MNNSVKNNSGIRVSNLNTQWEQYEISATSYIKGGSNPTTDLGTIHIDH